MRLFIAVNFDGETKDRLCAMQARLRLRAARGNFSRRENLHLTLAFLGEVDPARLPGVRRAMTAVCCPPAALTFDTAGCFRRGGGDIWWAGVERSPALLRLQRELAAALREEGFAPDGRRFTPHITLAREVSLSERPDAESLLDAPFFTCASRISLMQSQRLRGTLTYSEIFSRDMIEGKGPDI